MPDVPAAVSAVAAAEDAAKRKAANDLLWRAGALVWKCDQAQKTIYADVTKARADGKSRFVVLCARRFGKTHLCALLALEQCLRRANCQVAFVSKTKRSAKEIAEKLIRQILSDCPAPLRPIYKRQEFRWDFKNGSSLSFLGCDSGHYEKARGREFHLVLVDEAGFIDNLDEIWASIFAPTLLTTNGFALFASTPPATGSHPFLSIVREAQSEGAFCLKTIHDNPRLTIAQIRKAERDCGGPESVRFRREYMCEVVTEDSRSVIPEWNQKKSEELVREEPRPQWCDRYIALDFGFTRDLTVGLFGYWNFAQARLVIEDEIVLKGATTARIAQAVAQKTAELWGTNEEEMGTVYRYSDVDPRLLYELRTLHGLNLTPTEKSFKQAHIHTIRLMVGAGEIAISPRCRTLIKTLFAAQWNKTGDKFDRNDPEAIGHADALDALIYMARNVKRSHNPVPPGQTWQERDGFVRPAPKVASPGARSFFAATTQRARPRGRRVFGV